MSHPLFAALIRTHHITSRKKVAKLRAAASRCNIYALIRYGGCPGVMFCQGTETRVRDWVSDVQRLRYKDFRLAIKPVEKIPEQEVNEDSVSYGRLEEVESVKEFGAKMESLGVFRWWRKGMGYVGND
jgi:hypothetical protein